MVWFCFVCLFLTVIFVCGVICFGVCFCFPKLMCIVITPPPSFFFFIQLQLEVHEAKPVPENHPQWDTAIEGDEDQEDSEGFEDSFEEEEEEEEDDD